MTTFAVGDEIVMKPNEEYVYTVGGSRGTVLDVCSTNRIYVRFPSLSPRSPYADYSIDVQYAELVHKESAMGYTTGFKVLDRVLVDGRAGVVVAELDCDGDYKVCLQDGSYDYCKPESISIDSAHDAGLQAKFDKLLAVLTKEQLIEYIISL